MVKKIEKIKNIEYIYIIMLSTIFISNLFVGTPIKYNIMYTNLLLNIVALVIILIDFIKNKEKIAINMIDILVGIIAVSSLFPLIFNTYLRLADTIEYILRYMSAFNIYIISKKLTKEKNNFIKNVSNIIIVSSITLIIFGIDMMTQNVFNKLYQILGTATVYNESKNRMTSLFKYPNAFAIFIVISIILTVMQYINSNEKKIKILYIICLFIEIFALIMTYSRMCWLILVISLIIYYYCTKDRTIRKEWSFILIITSINSLIYLFIFNILQMRGYHILIYIVLIMQSLAIYIILYNKEKIKCNKKIFKIIASILILSTISILVYILLAPKTLVLFNSKNSKHTYRKQNIIIQPDTQYILEFNIEAKSNKENNFKIQCKELNKDEKQIAIHEIIFDEYEGKKEIKFNTEKDTHSLTIVFNNTSEDVEGYLKIESIKINGKDEKINYKLIPIELINRINKIKLDTASIRGRIDYYKKSLAVIKDNCLVGQGGYAWKNNSITSKSGTIAEHSYLLQLFMQNGILAFIAYMLLIIYILRKFLLEIKEKENMDIIGITIMIFSIILHTLCDFDMYFLNILLIFYMYIAMISCKTEKNEVFIHYKYTYIYIIFILVAIYFSIGEIISPNIDTYNVNNNETKIKYINAKIAMVPYDYRYREEKINYLFTLKNQGTYKINSVDYISATQEIIKQSRYLLDIEKKKSYNNVNILILNYIDIINKDNEKEILSKIEKDFNQVKEKELMYTSIKSRFKKIYFNDNIEEFLKKLENNIDEKHINGYN